MILSKFINNFNEFTDVEKKIAENILEQPEIFSELSVAEIAERLYVSKTSIINFAQKMGFQGFSELRYFIRTSLENKNSTNKKSTFEEVNEHLAREVQKTFELVQETHLITFCNHIKEAKTLYILARGITKQFATAFTFQLRVMNIIAIFVDDYNLIKTLPTTLKDDDTVLIISLSGETDILVEFTNRALAKKATILSLTSFGHNPINQMSDYYLNFYSDTEIEKYRELDSRMGMHIVLQQVVEYLKLEN